MSKQTKHHLIFEGAELAGKSWLMSQVYDFLESKYNQNKVVLDGCHWFNCDVGIYGTKFGAPVIRNFISIFEVLRNKNLLVEKFFLSDKIYNRLHNKKEINYSGIEKKLEKLNFKIILVVFPEKEKIIRARIKDRLQIYPHYEKILRNPQWYIKQQQEYKKEIAKTKLPYLIIETEKLPNYSLADQILKWLDEK